MALFTGAKDKRKLYGVEGRGRGVGRRERGERGRIKIRTGTNSFHVGQSVIGPRVAVTSVTNEKANTHRGSRPCMRTLKNYCVKEAGKCEREREQRARQVC